jgi:hypothetical protein
MRLPSKSGIAKTVFVGLDDLNEELQNERN